MIVNIRGTSGSGKSTLVRKVIEACPSKITVKRKGRKRPIAYLLTRDTPGPKLVVPGHYETACGGCDTIPSYDDIFSIVREAHNNGHDVLFEGLLVSAESRRSIELAQDGYPLHVIAIDLPLQDCVDAIQERRSAKGNTKPINPRNTEQKWKGTRSSCRKLEEAGVPVEWFGREGALERVFELLRFV